MYSCQMHDVCYVKDKIWLESVLYIIHYYFNEFIHRQSMSKSD